MIFITISNRGLSSPVDHKSLKQQDPPEANTMVNVTFKDSDTTINDQLISLVLNYLGWLKKFVDTMLLPS